MQEEAKEKEQSTVIVPGPGRSLEPTSSPRLKLQCDMQVVG